MRIFARRIIFAAVFITVTLAGCQGGAPPTGQTGPAASSPTSVGVDTGGGAATVSVHSEHESEQHSRQSQDSGAATGGLGAVSTTGAVDASQSSSAWGLDAARERLGFGWQAWFRRLLGLVAGCLMGGFCVLTVGRLDVPSWCRSVLVISGVAVAATCVLRLVW